MVGFKIGDEFLDMEGNTSVQMEIHNPLFNVSEEQGVFSYNSTVGLSKHNLRLLGFPGSVGRRAYQNAPIPAALWIGKRAQLFRIGNLQVGERGTTIQISFQSDAQALNTVAKDRLKSIDLGGAQLNLTVKQPYPDDLYALFPLCNNNFFGDGDQNSSTYVNFFRAGVFSKASDNQAGRYPITPFPYLVHVLRKVFAHYGYEVTGEWLESEFSRSLVIYNTYAYEFRDFYPDPVDFRNHMPDITVADFLKGIRSRLGLAFVFNAKSKTVAVVTKKDCLRNAAATDWTALAHAGSTWAGNNEDGFTLGGAANEEDGVVQSMPAGWDVVRTGNGAAVLSDGCGTVPMRKWSHLAPAVYTWLVPNTYQPGNSLDFGTKAVPAGSLRLLSYQGLQPDSNGDLYPFATSATTNLNGKTLLPYGLQLTGPGNYYEAMHREWVDFLSETETYTKNVQLGIADLLQLDPLRKVVVRGEGGYLKAFWKKISFTLHATQGIKAAKVVLAKTMV